MLQTYAAHFDCVTGVSTSHDSSECFASSSRDKTVNMWDLRLPKPALYLYAQHICPFSTVDWTENNNIYAGDDSGHVHVIDSRVPKKFLQSIEVFDYCGVHKVKFNGWVKQLINFDQFQITTAVFFRNLFGVCGLSNTFKVFDAADDGKEVYSNSDAQNYVRDICWNPKNKEFYTVNWDAQLNTHVIKF